MKAPTDEAIPGGSAGKSAKEMRSDILRLTEAIDRLFGHNFTQPFFPKDVLVKIETPPLSAIELFHKLHLNAPIVTVCNNCGRLLCKNKHCSCRK